MAAIMNRGDMQSRVITQLTERVMEEFGPEISGLKSVLMPIALEKLREFAVNPMPRDDQRKRSRLAVFQIHKLWELSSKLQGPGDKDFNSSFQVMVDTVGPGITSLRRTLTDLVMRSDNNSVSVYASSLLYAEPPLVAPVDYLASILCKQDDNWQVTHRSIPAILETWEATLEFADNQEFPEVGA